MEIAEAAVTWLITKYFDFIRILPNGLDIAVLALTYISAVGIPYVLSLRSNNAALRMLCCYLIFAAAFIPVGVIYFVVIDSPVTFWSHYIIVVTTLGFMLHRSRKE